MTFKRIERQQKIGEPLVIVIGVDQRALSGEYSAVADLSGWTFTAKARTNDAAGTALGDFTATPLGASAVQLALPTTSFAEGVVAVDVRAAASPDVVYSETLYFAMVQAVTR